MSNGQGPDPSPLFVFFSQSECSSNVINTRFIVFPCESTMSLSLRIRVFNYVSSDLLRILQKNSYQIPRFIYKIFKKISSTCKLKSVSQMVVVTDVANVVVPSSPSAPGLIFHPVPFFLLCLHLRVCPAPDPVRTTQRLFSGRQSDTV